MTDSIKISELLPLALVNDDDFFAVVDSGSLTTYRVSINSLGSWMAISGSVISASWAGVSISASYSQTASFAISSSHALNSDISISSSYAFTASYLNGDAITNATNAIFAIQSIYATQSLYATQSIYATSASWASSSISASYATTASYAITSSHSLTASYALNAPIGGGVAPIGSIMDYAGVLAPDSASGWVGCDGGGYDTTVYSSAFAVLGYTWGGAGSTFNVPDLRKRTTFGADGIQTRISGSVGNSGGGENLVRDHYHAIARMNNAYNGSPYEGTVLNDDLEYAWIGNKTLNVRTDFPIVNYTMDPYFGVNAYRNDGTYDYGQLSTNGSASFLVTGDDAGRRTNPVSRWGSSSLGIHPNVDRFSIGSSFALSEVNPDIMIPYATVNKIIRLA